MQSGIPGILHGTWPGIYIMHQSDIPAGHIMDIHHIYIIPVSSFEAMI